MKIYNVIYISFLLSVLATTPVHAEFPPSGNSSVYEDYYGIVDAINPKESRMIINDISVVYNHASRFHNTSGRKISNITSALKTGTPIRFHVFQKPHHLILSDLKIISMQEYKKSRIRDRDD